MNESKAISLIMEVSQGCQMNCQGCYVDKQVGTLPSVDSQLAIDSFLYDLFVHDYFLDEVEVGPTDLVSSSNRREIFNNTYLKSLLSKAILNTFQVSLIHPAEKISGFIKDIDSVAGKNSKVNITTPLEIQHVFNDKYIGLINSNAQRIRSESESNVSEIVLSIIVDIERLLNVGSTYDYAHLFERVQELSFGTETLVDFVFHHGRRGFDDPRIVRSFLYSFKAINDCFEQSFIKSEGKNTINRLPSQLVIQKDRPVELVLRKDKLFVRPILNQGFVLEDSRFEFTQPWTFENYQLKLIDEFSRNLSYAMTITDCQSCEHVVLCAGRNMHDVMSLSKSNECIYLLKDYKPIQLQDASNYISEIEKS